MHFTNRIPILSLLAGAALVLPGLSSACSSCGCTLSSDWGSLGFSTSYGFKVDFRYDYLNQNQLRSGTGTISSAKASQVVNDGDPQEVEKFTENHYLTLGLEYNLNPELGINVQLPYIIRNHTTLGTASDGTTPGAGGEQYHSETSNSGDIKLMVRYQSFIPALHNFGVLLGAKLPTGSFTETGTSTDTTEPGDVDIDRGLQPGTGTTDLIVGVYYFDGLAKDWNYFVQALYQKALYSRDRYQPGDGSNLNLGMRYTGFSRFNPQVQLNGRYVAHDLGANADVVSTGGTLLYLSPGVVIPIVNAASVYGFLQVPVFQDVRGVQVDPEYSASIGARFSF
jgi:TonB dependent receptor